MVMVVQGHGCHHTAIKRQAASMRLQVAIAVQLFGQYSALLVTVARIEHILSRVVLQTLQTVVGTPLPKRRPHVVVRVHNYRLLRVQHR